MDHQFEIVTDSTCDLPVEELAELGVEMVPLHVFVGDGCYLDQIEIKPKEFYAKMAAAEELPHSSQPSPSAFATAFAKLAEEGAKQVLSIHISGALSGTANSAALAAQDSPVPVCVWDTKIGTSMQGIYIKEACHMRDAGETLEVTLAHLEKLREQSSLVFVLDTLENIVKNGRCSRAKGLMSAVLNIKAVLHVTDEGALEPIAKGRGMQRAYQDLAKIVEAKYGAGARLTAAFATSDNEEGCKECLEVIEKRGITVDLQGTYSAGPVISTHTGIGLVAFSCVPTEMLYRG